MKDFHPLYIQGRAARQDGRGGEEPIVVDRHRAVYRVHVGESADAAHGCAVIGRLIDEARREVGQVLHGRDADQVALLTGEGRDRDGNILQALFAFFRGHHQLVDSVHRVLGLSREPHRAGRENARSQKKSLGPHPLVPPHIEFPSTISCAFDHAG